MTKKVRPPTLPKEAIKGFSKFYNERDDIYDKLRASEDRENKIPKAILKHLDKGKVVLDLGCGTGNVSLLLARKARLAYALDKSRPLLRVLRKKIRSRKIRNIRVLESGYGRIPLPRESVDIVFSCLSFPAHSGNWERDLKEAKRVLKKGGEIILLEAHPSGEFQRIKKKLQKPEFYSKMNRFMYDLHKWLASKGFKYRVINIVNDFGSKRNIENLCAPFFGYELATYLLARDRTGFRMRLSIFRWKKS